jgi:3-oxoacyl-[acyl-carrier protein] reductase
MAEFGRIDIMVNNAGVHPHVSVSEMTDEQWDDMIAVNLTAPFLLTRAVLPIMKEQRTGNIMGVSSGAGSTNPRADSTGYGATKAALDRMYFNLAEEVKAFDIAVNTWMPGVLLTDMNAASGVGEPVEVAEPSALWVIAQDAARFTGQNVRREDFGTKWGTR